MHAMSLAAIRLLQKKEEESVEKVPRRMGENNIVSVEKVQIIFVKRTVLVHQATPEADFLSEFLVL